MGYIGIIFCLGAGLALIALCYGIDRINTKLAAKARLRARVQRIAEEG